ncbi:MAG: class I SAM-dependent methyltransferase [Clostridiales bacterium]|nr:class I SAM-dependent methyltransferase [Clostridiales bacterium]
MSAYTVLAEFYDKLSYDFDYAKWSGYLYRLLSGHVGPSARGADLACGSGRLTIELKKLGLDVIGVDISPQMLNRAAQNAAKERLAIHFIQSDMASFKVHRKLDFITCANDGVNYMEKSRLLPCFKNFYRNLSSKGVLLFDISSEHKLKNILSSSVFFEDTDELTYIWNNRQLPEAVEMELIFFVRQGANYLRFDENHIQYIYRVEEIEQALLAAGFRQVRAFDFLTELPSRPDSERIQFLAKK